MYSSNNWNNIQPITLILQNNLNWFGIGQANLSIMIYFESDTKSERIGQLKNIVRESNSSVFVEWIMSFEGKLTFERNQSVMDNLYFRGNNNETNIF